jgi:DNA-binding protein HU-beta
VSDSLSQDKEVSITGFGKFYVSNRAAREGINPQTKEKIQISATKVPLFKAGKGLKDKVK